MAQPWKHPTTGVYYLRRQVPEALRLAFDGKALWKASLRTKNACEATVLFLQANAALEQRFEEARARLKASGNPCPSPRDRADELVTSYFGGPERAEGGLDGPERLRLARLEVDRGLWNETPNGCSPVAASTADEWWQLVGNAALFRDHPGTRKPVAGHDPGSIWRWSDDSFRPGAKARQVARVLEQIARHHGLSATDLRGELAGAVASFLDKAPVEAPKERRRHDSPGRLRPGMRMMELFAEWKAVVQPREQSAHEYEGAARDFVDYVGNIPIGEITHDDLMNYRDKAAKLPRTMPRAHRALSFSERLERHGTGKGPRVGPATLKKRIGGIQALLSFAFLQSWIPANVTRDVPITGYTKAAGTRNTFQEEDLQKLLGSKLFMEPKKWRSDRAVTDCTLYWLFLIGMTTGARLEEVGQAKLRDVKTSGSIVYIDIEDYSEDGVIGDKSLKTDMSRRLVPVHANLIRLGFVRYCEALREAGMAQLFPDLVANQFGKRTKEASRTANRMIDRVVSKDARLVFHSFRHGLKDLALEAGVLERIVDQICGHAPTSVGGKYGKGVRLPVLNRELHRVDWSFLDWSALEKNAFTLDWRKIVRSASGAARQRGSQISRP